MIHAFAIALASLALAADPAPVKWPPLPKEGKHVDYIKWYDEVRRAGMKPEDDAFPIYKKIFPTLDATDPNAKRPDEFRFAGHNSDDKRKGELGPWDPKDHPDWEAAYQRTQPAVRKFMRAAAKPGYVLPTRFSSEAEKTGKLMYFITLPDLQEFRAYAKGLSDVAWRAPGGRIDGKLFLKSIRARLGATRQIERNPMLIAQLVACANSALLYQDIQYALKFKFLSPTQLADLQATLSELDAPFPPMAFAITGECAFLMDVIQYIDGHPGKIDDQIVGGIAEFYRKSELSLDECAAEGREYYETLARLYAEPGLPSDKSREKYAKRAKKLRDSNKVIQVVSSGFDKAHSLRLRTESWRSAIRLLLAINAYKQEQQSWPESLDDLPADLDEFKRDPVSNKTFVYRVVDGEPLLYSLGANLKDDGGVHDPKFEEETPDTDFVFWPPQSDSSRTQSASPTKPPPARKKGKKSAPQPD